MGKIPDRPFLNQSFSPRGGGIDFLGMRAVNLRMLQDFLIPGVNNATSDFGTYCLAAWIPWKFQKIASSKENFTYSHYKEFREAVEIAIAYSQRPESVANQEFGSPRTRIGVQQKVNLDQPLSFNEANRTDATSLFAAPLYGPSLRYLQLITGDAIADDGTSTHIPLTATDNTVALLVEEVESSLKASKNFSSFDQLEVPKINSESLDDLGMHGFHPSYYRRSRPEIKRAFLQKFLVPSRPGDAADYRRLTAWLICETIRQYEFKSPEELRACWYTGLLPTGAPLELVDNELVQHRRLWALFQSRQIQRTISELFLRCFELGLKWGAKSVSEVLNYWQQSSVKTFDLESWDTFEDFIRSEAETVLGSGSFKDISKAWHATVHEKHPSFDDISEGDIEGELERAFRMMARWWIRTQKWLLESESDEFLNMGERSRMSARWFNKWLNDRLSMNLSKIGEDIFSEIVFAQHIKVALSRFDGKVQRLRFTLGDSGIIPTTVAAKKLGQSPFRMADRLPSFLGLLSDLDVIKWQEGVPLEVGTHTDFLLKS
ncbi:MAG: hypothetical protein CME32_11580 [Gimesia sp.]|nr:hypothetical protein [Gimesia sp.]